MVPGERVLLNGLSRGSRAALALLVVGGVLLAGGLAGCKKAAEPAAKTYEWQTELVDAEAKYVEGWWRGSTGQVGLALDASGNLHASYHVSRGGDDTLKYGKRTADGWRVEAAVDRCGSYCGWDNSLAVDPSGRPWLATTNGNGDFLLLSRESEGWEFPTEAQATEGGDCPALAVDGLGQLHVTYISDGQWVGRGLRHAWRDARGSHGEAVDPDTVDSVQSLAVSRDGVPHIAYLRDDSVRYATKTDGSWQTTAVSESGWNDTVDIALDSAGNPHIAFTQGIARYAVQVDGQWKVEDIDAGLRAQAVSIAIDPEGKPVVAFVDGEQLFCAVRVNGKWLTKPVTAAPSGTRIALAVGPGGAFIVYYRADGLYCAIGK